MTDPRLRILTEDPLNAEVPWEALHLPRTPNDLFFKRNHFALPDVDASGWTVLVEGGRHGQLRLDLEHLAHFGRHGLEAILECAGNGRTLFEPKPGGTPWTLGAASNASWSGVPLQAVLEEAGVPEDAREVYSEGADGHFDREKGPYARSLPLEMALHRDVLLAWEMNDQPLPREHGGPVRLLVPGWYGMASVKWLRRIAFLREPFQGFFQAQDYVFRPRSAESRPVSGVVPRALIVQPQDGARVGSDVVVEGWAWSGSGPITRVEVALDGRWQEAELGEERGAYAWRRFRLRTSLSAGERTIEARATDAAGRSQPDQAIWNKGGYENNAPHRIRVMV